MLILTRVGICCGPYIESDVTGAESNTSVPGSTTEDSDQQEHGPLSAAAQALADFTKCNTSLEQLRMRSCGLSDVAVKAMSAGLCGEQRSKKRAA